MKKTAQFAIILSTTAIGLAAMGGVASAADPEDAVGCTTELTRTVSSNPNDPVPTATVQKPATVEVSANGTIAFVGHDVTAVGTFVACVV